MHIYILYEISISSNYLFNAIISNFAMNGLDGTYLKRNLVTFVNDGDSTMLGRISGVGIQLQRKIFDIVITTAWNWLSVCIYARFK